MRRRTRRRGSDTMLGGERERERERDSKEEKNAHLRLRLVHVKVFPENILFSGNAIFRKGKCFHVFSCISKNVSKNIFWCLVVFLKIP